MSISKLRSAKSALGQHQQQNQHENANSNAKTPKSDGPAASATANSDFQGKMPGNFVTAATVAAATGTGAGTSSSSSSSVAKYLGTSTTANATQQQQPLPPPSSHPQQSQQTFLPQTSLLKIKPFVPSLNTRLRRPIGRSYSTLSSTYLKRTSNGPWGQGCSARTDAIVKHTDSVVVGAAIDRSAALPKTGRPAGNVRRQPIKVITHQRSKSTSSSATSTTNRPATAAVNGNHTAPSAPPAANSCSNGGGAIVTPQPNGICRIARLPKEQEKLPDRINYDRRGLTAIPIFENESNLRLLSLQHNLINVFHIPKEEEPYEPLCMALCDDNAQPVKLENNNVKQHDARWPNGAAPGGTGGCIPDGFGRQLNANNNHGNRSNCVAARLPLSLASSTANADTAMTGVNCYTTPSPTPPPLTAHPLAYGSNGPVSQFLKRNNLLQNLNFNAPHALATQQQQQHQKQQQQQHSHYRFAMKKSKSFITNCSRHVGNVKRGMQRPPLNKTEAKMLVLLGRTNLKSFDSSGSCLTNDTLSTLAISEMEEEESYIQQLEIKNKQLQASYGPIFQNLVFLDLYDNQIERIANLDGLSTLSVLLLGKNRITDISGLVSLRDTLRVLDLHGNKITSISNKINCLQGLKSLNLAGNQIRQINQNDFNGLLNLKELNLKRNRIRRINGFQHLTALQRLWLCHNDLHKVEDMSSIAKAANLLEVTIENNPVSLAGDCVSYLVSYLPNLMSLSQMPITDQVRRAAMAWRKNKELSEANHTHHSPDVFNNIRREEVISNARTNWELLRSQQTVQTALRNQRSPHQRELAKISESNETVVGYEDLQEYIKLPPIQQQQLPQSQPEQQQSKKAEEQVEIDRLSSSSNSSLGPNVDSSSSSYSSDNEETPKKQSAENLRAKKTERPNATSSERQTVPKFDNVSKESSQEGSLNSTTEPAKDNEGSKIALNSNTSQTDTKSLVAESKNGTETTCSPDLACAEDLQCGNNNSSPQGIMHASVTPLPHPEPDPASSSVPATTMPVVIVSGSTQSRTPTPVTAITASSSVLCLGYNHQTNNVCHNGGTTVTTIANANSSAVTTTAIATMPATPGITTATTCKRYMRGSLMRSHVVVGGVGSSSGGGGGKTKLAARSNTAIQLHSHQNISSGMSNGLPMPSSIVSIVAPAGGSGNGGSQNTAAAPSTAAKAPSTAASSCTATTQVNGQPTTTSATSNPSPTAVAPVTLAPTTAPVKPQAAEREREQGGDYLIEICGRYLNIYGQGALRFIDKQWNPTKASDVHTLNFSYINFNNIIAVLARIKVRFPHAENFVFRETNISCLGQLNALAELQGIVSLFIDPEGNAITTKDLWRQYAVYRLSHWGLKLLNGTDISAAEVDEANIMYAGLSDLVLWSMPDVMLQPLLARLRLDETCTASKMSPKEWLMKPENKSLRLVVGKEALQWKKPSAAVTGVSTGASAGTGGATIMANSNAINNLGQQLLQQQQQQQHQQQPSHHLFQQQHYGASDAAAEGQGAAVSAGTLSMAGPSNTTALSTRERGKMHFGLMMENTCNAVEKLHKLETLWPSLLLDIVRNTLLDYSQLDAYLRNLMSEIMK